MPESGMLGVPSSASKTQPARLTDFVVDGLYNSIHSSFGDASVPAQATSLMITERTPKGVGVVVRVGVRVGVLVLVGVPVLVTVGVSEGVDVCVKV